MTRHSHIDHDIRIKGLIRSKIIWARIFVISLAVILILSSLEISSIFLKIVSLGLIVTIVLITYGYVEAEYFYRTCRPVGFHELNAGIPDALNMLSQRSVIPALLITTIASVMWVPADPKPGWGLLDTLFLALLWVGGSYVYGSYKYLEMVVAIGKIKPFDEEDIRRRMPSWTTQERVSEVMWRVKETHHAEQSHYFNIASKPSDLSYKASNVIRIVFWTSVGLFVSSPFAL